MKNIMNKVIGAAAMALALGMASTATQASLIGETVDVAILTHDSGTTNVISHQQVIVVENAVELTGFGIFDVDIEADTLTGIFNTAGTIDSHEFAGLAFLNLDFSNTGKWIAGFLGGSTNIAGFDASRIVFDAHNVGFNFSNLTVAVGDYVTVQLDIRSVPAPATLPLMGLGFAALVALRMRKQSV